MNVAVRPRRAIAFGAALVLLAVAAFAAQKLLSGDEPPVNGAAKLAPKDTLVYVHASTDGDRDAVERVSELLTQFDFFAGFRDQTLQRLVGTTKKVTPKDLEPWLGDEAALALVDAGQATAGSLVIVQVKDVGEARKFLARNPRRSAIRRYKGDRVDEFGAVNVAFADGYMLIGQPPTVNGALDLSNGRGEPLTKDPTYRQATSKLPADRAGDAFITAGGLRRLLVPQGDVIGSLAVMLEQPGLRAAAVSAEARDEGLKLNVRSLLDPKQQQRSDEDGFDPQLVEAVPRDTMAYLGTSGISGTLGNLVAAAAGGANAGGVGPLLGRLRTELGKQTDGALERDLLKLFDGEVAVVLNQATPAPTLSLVTKTGDEDRTASVLRRLQQPLVKLLTPEGEQAPRWSRDDVGDGVVVQTLTTPAGVTVSYAVFDGRLVLGTGPAAIRRIKDAEENLTDDATFASVTKGRRDQVTSLGFLDFTQLLELGEQTGLNDSRSYLAAREDLRRIRAIGISSHATEGETTAEILLQIP